MMGVLVCDICGGKLTMQAGGIAVCNVCGMGYSKEALQEKYLSSGGRSIVQIDNSNMVNRWMEMAADASRAGNEKEAYEYYSKVVEIDPLNWRAIFEKGKAAAWQSTVANPRIFELDQAVRRAARIVETSELSETDKAEVKNEFAFEISMANNEVINQIYEDFQEHDDRYVDTDLKRVFAFRSYFLKAADIAERAIALIADYDDENSISNVIALKKDICHYLVSACGYWGLWTDHSQTNLYYVGYTSEEKKDYIVKFWNLVEDIRKIEPDYTIKSHSLMDPFDPPKVGENTYSRLERIVNYWNKMESDKKKNAAQKRYV